MILVAFRHGLRAIELVDLRWDQVDFSFMGGLMFWQPSRFSATLRITVMPSVRDLS